MIKVTADFSQTLKHLDNVQAKQIPFAAVGAINDVAFIATKRLASDVSVYLDRPTDFTRGGFQVQKANKRNLTGYVYVEQKREPYLKYQIHGGTAKRAAVPVNAKLNEFGNIKARRTGLVKGRHQFVGTYNGVKGVYERGHISKKGKFTLSKKKRSTSIRLIVAFNTNVVYKKIFPFYRITEQVTSSRINKAFQAKFKRALETAR